MKRTFQLIIVVILTTSYLHSQDISINLSIRWNEGPFILNTDSIAKYPELVMSFTNISKDNLCFKKFSYYQFGLADFLYYEIPNFDHNTAKKHINYRKTIPDEFIENGTCDQLVLLKPGETKEDVFNITCCYLVKGAYTFILNGECHENNVFTAWKKDNDGKQRYGKV